MLLGMGCAELIVGLPVLIAAIMAECTPTTITMASWVTFHGLLGVLLGLSFYFLYALETDTKRRVRIVYFALIILGIAISIAAAIHGGVGRVTKTTTAVQNYTEIVPVNSTKPVPPLMTNYTQITRQRTVQLPETNRHGFPHYDFDLFFGIFLAVFEACLLAWGIWSLYADREKAKQILTLANMRNESFASMAAYRQVMEQETMKKSHSGFFGRQGGSALDLTEPEAPENAEKQHKLPADVANGTSTGNKTSKSSTKKEVKSEHPENVDAVERQHKSPADVENGTNNKTSKSSTKKEVNLEHR